MYKYFVSKFSGPLNFQDDQPEEVLRHIPNVAGNGVQQDGGGRSQQAHSHPFHPRRLLCGVR